MGVLSIAASPVSAAVPPVVVGGCNVRAAVVVRPGLTLSAGPFSYSYTGALDGCFYSGAGAASGGVITAGRPLTVGGRQYLEPTPAGTGDCAITVADGYDFTRWNNGRQTIVHFHAVSIGGATTITGSVVPSLELQAVNPRPGEPASVTFRSTLFVGQNVAGAVLFAASNPALCLSRTGITSATITGLLTHTNAGA
jgi:hypothetical protein